MGYKFYGWETADVKDAEGRTPRDYYDLLTDVWCRETCAPASRLVWSEENKTAGQCSITAFAIQDIYGGDVYGIPLDDGNFHCFNKVGDCVFDLTSEQFGDKVMDYEHSYLQDRNVHFANEDKKSRYELLKEKLIARMNKQAG